MISLFEASVFMAKTAIVLVFVMTLYRLLGKRYVALLNVYDLVTVSAVANAVQNAMTEGRGELLIGLVSAFTLIFGGWLVTRVLIKAPKLQKFVSGIPTLLVYQGTSFPDRMRREHVSESELEEAMHAHGIDDLSQVGMAVLEPDGSISVVPTGRGCTFETDLI
jgi:uncharacterized membrane protein YcaP (DUF421 family)